MLNGAGNGNDGIAFPCDTDMERKMRLLLLIAVIALGVDALKFDGAYTQSAWREISSQLSRLEARLDDGDLFDREVASTDTTERR